MEVLFSAKLTASKFIILVFYIREINLRIFDIEEEEEEEKFLQELLNILCCDNEHQIN